MEVGGIWELSIAKDVSCGAGRYSLLRFTGMQNINAATEVEWADRKLPSHLSFQVDKRWSCRNYVDL